MTDAMQALCARACAGPPLCGDAEVHTRRTVLGAATHPAAALGADPDAGLRRLFEGWRAERRNLLANIKALGIAETAAWRAGLQDDARVEALTREQETIYRRLFAYYREMALTPAASVQGAALKLMLWRHEAIIGAGGGIEQPQDVCAFSVYCDLLRLAGVDPASPRMDQATWQYIAAPDGFSGEDWRGWTWSEADHEA